MIIVRTLFAIVLVAHGLIHLMGVAKAFGYADLPQLAMPISRTIGWVWLVAAVLWLATAAALFASPRGWWMLGAAAIVVSQLAIAASWTDARAGSLVNVAVLFVVLYGFMADGPLSLRAAYEREVDAALARTATASPVTEADLARLPPPVQRYLRRAGVVGQPRVWNLRARMHGRIRSGPAAAWMPFIAEQYNFYDRPSRLFHTDAARMLVPFQVFHRYVGDQASMRVKVGGLVSVVNRSGQDMTEAETVTMFNDMCMLATPSLIDPAIAWRTDGERTVRAAFTNAGHTVHAELQFSDIGDLIDFQSDDRRQDASDGGAMRKVRWSTPLGAPRAFGPFQLSSSGEARWHEAEGDYAYIQVTLDDVQYNLARR